MRASRRNRSSGNCISRDHVSTVSASLQNMNQSVADAKVFLFEMMIETYRSGLGIIILSRPFREISHENFTFRLCERNGKLKAAI